MIKNKMIMEKMLIENGFIASSLPNTWIKGDWTIRFDAEMIEAYDDAENGQGLYYCGPIDKVDLQVILDDIYNFEYRD